MEIQLTDLVYFEDGSIKSANANFIAENIPSLGYKTFYLQYSNEQIKQKKSVPEESDFYKIQTR